MKRVILSLLILLGLGAGITASLSVDAFAQGTNPAQNNGG